MTTDDIAPPRGDRVVFVGQTGSGKTTAARVLLEQRRYVVAIDAKGLLRWPNYTVLTTLKGVTESKAEKIIYRPSWHELQDPDELEAFFSWVYQCGNRTCYVDETMGVTQGDVYPPHLGACLTRGRELGIDMWCATQRPKRIPMPILSESEHMLVFKLKLDQDRQRVEEVTGIAAERIARLPKHDFLYSRQDAEVVGPLRLNLSARSLQGVG